MSNSKRTNSPVATAVVPWAVPIGQEKEYIEQHNAEQAAVQAFERADAEIQAITGIPNDSVQMEPVQDLKSLFAPAPTHGKSVFAPPPKAEVKAPEPEFSMEGAPSWGELVAFVQKHGKTIVQVRYPRPLGEAIDTLWRGVTVIKHESTEVRHEKHGWIKWEDAIY